MKAARFPALVAGVARLAGLGESPGAESKAKIAEFLTARADQAYSWDFWAEWLYCEQRAYRDSYDAGAAYAPTADAPVERYYPPADSYYQALRATTGNAPATDTGGTWAANTAYWAECQISYSGDDWAATTDYTAGITVRNPDDGRFYMCHTAHTSGSTFDATKFGLLTVFERYIDYGQTGQTPIDMVKALHWFDPRTGTERPSDLPFKLTDRGVEPRNGGLQGAAGWYYPWNGGGIFGAAFIPTKVWIEFLRPAPVFGATSFVTDGSYFEEDVVVNDGEGEDGECYKALVDDPGNDLTDATKWEKQVCPRRIAEFVKRAAAADLLRPDGQHQKAGAEDSPAFEFLLRAHDKAFAGQAQTSTIKAKTY